MEKVQGIANWAFVNKPNCKFNEEGKWMIDIICDAKTIKTLKEAKINLIEKDDGRIIFRPQRHVKRRDGENNQAPAVFDRYANTLTCNIGNGSKVEVAFTVFPYGKIKGNGADLCGVKVLELVPYEDGDNVAEAFEFEKPEKVNNMFD